jgi:hypothetical protein
MTDRNVCPTTMSSTVGAIYLPATAARDNSVVRQLLAAISLGLLGLMVGLAAIFVARRVTGALVNPLNGGGLVLAALTIELAIVLYRCFESGTEFFVLSTQYLPRWPRSLPPRAVFSLIIPSLAAFAILLSLTIPGTPAWGLVLAWCLLIFAESISWLLHFRPDVAHATCLAVSRVSIHSAPEIEHAEIPSGLIQQLTRTLAGERESIHALAKVEIAANDRFAAVHIAFCPPLAAPPALSAHAIDTDDADVRITQTETFGVRLEVRLPGTKPAPRSVMIEILDSAARL